MSAARWCAPPPKKGIKTAIHEQNAFPGVTNKLLAKDVDVVFAASAAAVEKLGAPEKTPLWLATLSARKF